MPSVSVQAFGEGGGRSYSQTVLKDQAVYDPTTTTDQHVNMLICGSRFAQKLRKS